MASNLSKSSSPISFLKITSHSFRRDAGDENAGEQFFSTHSPSCCLEVVSVGFSRKTLKFLAYRMATKAASAVAGAVMPISGISPSLLLALLLLMLIIFLISDTAKPKKFPPGPPWLPVVGAMPHMKSLVKKHGQHQHLAMDSLRRQYGDIVGFRMGRVHVIGVFGLPAVQAVLTSEAYDARPCGFFYQMRCRGNRLGVVFTEGSAWAEQRRFTVQQLKKFGLGRSKMECLICEEADDLLKYLETNALEKDAFPLHNLFDVAVVNSLWAMMAGRRFELDNPRLASLLQTLRYIFRNAEAAGSVLNHMPFLRFIAPEWSGYNRSLAHFQHIWSFIGETITEHLKTNGSQARDFIDAFLEENKKRANQENSTFTEKQLMALLVDLFMAGAETTSNSLGFALLYLLRHQDVMRRFQDEIDNVVGGHRRPQLSDRPALPFVEAVIMETQRLSNTPPLGVPHRALTETQLCGYKIPKDSTVVLSLYSVHMDKNHWKNPEDFDPSRFLNEEGRIKTDEHFIPFGLGKRRCLGESLARANLFLLLTSLMQKFDIVPVPGFPLPAAGDDALPGITLSPKPFYGRLTLRHSTTPNL